MNLKRAAFSARLRFSMQNAVLWTITSAVQHWVAEHARVQGVGSLGPVFNVDLSH